MSIGMLGKKLGMTSVFSEDGKQYPCTVIDVTPNVVTQIKSEEKDGYSAVQLGFGERKDKHTTKPQKGHFEAAGTTPKRYVREFAPHSDDLTLGDEVAISELCEEGERIDVAGTSKGRGFQGVVKRHGFGGVGMSTHGQHNRQRAPGSIGASSWPSRVVKGLRMAGRMGNERVTVKRLRIVKIMADQNLVLVQGAVPGPKNGLVELRKQK